LAKQKKTFERPEIIITGEAVWPKLDVPDVYTPPKGETKTQYMTDLKVSDDDIKRFKVEWTKLARQYLEEVEGQDLDEDWRPKLPIIKDKKDKSLRLRATSKNKPPLFDTKNRRLPDSVVVGGGSKIKIAVTVNPYPMQGGGVNLYLNMVQVIDLKAGRAGFDGKSRFDEVEDGFEYDASDEAPRGDHNTSQEYLDDEIPF